MKTCFYCLFYLLFSCTAVWAQPGALDPSFSEDGYFIKDFGHLRAEARRVRVQNDGKILVASHTGSIASYESIVVTRYLPDGSPDSTFQEDGAVWIDVDGGSGVIALVDMLLLPDGRILLGANVTRPETGTRQAALYQLNSDGTPDLGFGVNGIAVTTIEAFLETEFTALARHAEGKIVACGLVTPFFGVQSVAVFRYFPDGMIDQTLSGTGVSILNLSTLSTTFDVVAVQPDSRILLAGQLEGNLVVARFNPEGTLDDTFAGGIQVLLISPDGDGASDMYLLPDGKILIGGYAYDVPENTSYNFMLLRLLPNGELDPAFGQSGVSILDIGNHTLDASRTLLRQPDGKILLAGYAHYQGHNRFAIARFHADGLTDQSFGNGGKKIYLFSPELSFVYSLAWQADGKIMACGLVGQNVTTNFTTQITVARIFSEAVVGIPEKTFGIESACLSPNPSSGQIQLEYSLSRPLELTIDLYDMQGRLVQNLRPAEQRPAGKQTETLHLDAAIAPGVYLLSVESETESKQLKVVKN